MKHIMIDLETMGNGKDAAIVAIGAVRFSRNGIDKELYVPVDLQSSLDAGLKMDASTVLWWMKQNKEAREAITKEDGVALQVALELLAALIDDETTVWCNGASFDFAILATAYRAVGEEVPWKFWNERDFRTIKKLFSDVTAPNDETAHNALEDAKNQAEHLLDIAHAKGLAL